MAFQHHEYKRSIDSFEQALMLYPNDKSNLRNLAHSYSRLLSSLDCTQEQLKKGIRLMSDVVAGNDPDVDIMMNLAIVHAKFVTKRSINRETIGR